jgi:hypothetical protein
MKNKIKKVKVKKMSIRKPKMRINNFFNPQKDVIEMWRALNLDIDCYELRFLQLTEHATILDLIQRVNQLSYVFDDMRVRFNSPHDKKLKELKKLFGKDIFKIDNIDTIKIDKIKVK